MNHAIDRKAGYSLARNTHSPNFSTKDSKQQEKENGVDVRGMEIQHKQEVKDERNAKWKRNVNETRTKSRQNKKR